MNAAMNGDATSRFLAAGADLLEAAVLQAQRDDPEGVAALRQILRGGGMARLSATLAASGVAWIHCEVIEPNGTEHSVATLELRRSLAT